MPAKKAKQQSPSQQQGKVLDPAEVRKNKEQELKGLSVKELEERYYNTYHTEYVPLETDDEEKLKNDLVGKIIAGSPWPPSPSQEPGGAPIDKGAKGDKKVKSKSGREFTISADNQGMVVVRQVQVQRVQNDLVELPSTEQVQTYYPDQFDKMLKDNFFSDSGMRVEILHKP
jgi:hypothetical protein